MPVVSVALVIISEPLATLPGAELVESIPAAHHLPRREVKALGLPA